MAPVPILHALCASRTEPEWPVAPPGQRTSTPTAQRAHVTGRTLSPISNPPAHSAPPQHDRTPTNTRCAINLANVSSLRCVMPVAPPACPARSILGMMSVHISTWYMPANQLSLPPPASAGVSTEAGACQEEGMHGRIPQAHACAPPFATLYGACSRAARPMASQRSKMAWR